MNWGLAEWRRQNEHGSWWGKTKLVVDGERERERERENGAMRMLMFLP
jgi:hypothetical protein